MAAKAPVMVDLATFEAVNKFDSLEIVKFPIIIQPPDGKIFKYMKRVLRPLPVSTELPDKTKYVPKDLVKYEITTILFAEIYSTTVHQSRMFIYRSGQSADIRRKTNYLITFSTFN